MNIFFPTDLHDSHLLKMNIINSRLHCVQGNKGFFLSTDQNTI